MQIEDTPHQVQWGVQWWTEQGDPSEIEASESKEAAQRLATRYPAWQPKVVSRVITISEWS